AGAANFGLGGRCRHRAVGIAHDDVVQSKGRAPVLGTLELRPADLDAMTAAEAGLARGGEPRRDNVDRERTAAEPPPQSAARNGGKAGHRAGADTAPAQAR